jgi:hypothetical protein
VGIESIEITDHARQRIHDNKRFNLGSFPHADTIKELTDIVVDNGKRLIDCSDKLRRWADNRRQKTEADVYYIYKDRVFVFRRKYRTFLREHWHLVLLTVLYHPFKDNEKYYGEKLLDKDLPNFDNGCGLIEFLIDQIPFR